jgi:tRNA dimethylallyltransferase
LNTEKKRPLLLIISGPTAVGKTDLSLQLAEQLQTCILSADSRQVYKELTIGTAKPSSEELSRVPHYFIDHISIHETYSAGQYEAETIPLIEELFQKHPILILVGGTTFYIKAITQGLDIFPSVPTSIKQQLQREWDETPEALRSELKEKDLTTYESIDLQNSRRVLRALEVIRASGKAFSSFKKAGTVKRSFDTWHIQLHRDREELYTRINERVLKMLDQGLEEEARALYAFRQKPPLQTVGYQEWWPYLDGKRSQKEVIQKIQQHSRNYAKRQLTWFRREAFWNILPAEETAQNLKYILSHPKTRAAL